MVKSAALAKPLPCIRTYIQNLFTISDMHYFDLGIHFLMLTWINNIHAVILKKNIFAGLFIILTALFPSPVPKRQDWHR